MAALYRPCRANFYRILHAKMFVFILKQFWDIHKVRFRFHITCHIVPHYFHGVWRLRKWPELHKSRPRKHRTWIKVAVKVKKLHLSRGFYTWLYDLKLEHWSHSAPTKTSRLSNQWTQNRIAYDFHWCFHLHPLSKSCDSTTSHGLKSNKCSLFLNFCIFKTVPRLNKLEGNLYNVSPPPGFIK